MTETDDAGAQPSESPKTILIGNQEMTVEMATLAARNSARWFWWIAGLSVINSIASLIQAEYSMVLELGLTQALDGLIFVLFGDWIGVGFHAFVLFMLWGGFGIARAIRAAEKIENQEEQ